MSETQELLRLSITVGGKSCNNLVWDGLIGLACKEHMLAAKVNVAIRYMDDCNTLEEIKEINAAINNAIKKCAEYDRISSAK